MIIFQCCHVRYYPVLCNRLKSIFLKRVLVTIPIVFACPEIDIMIVNISNEEQM